MAQFRPQFSIPYNYDERHLFDKEWQSQYFVFPTYRELKKNLIPIMKQYGVTQVSVSRSRRGEWGEWFEYWHLHGNKLSKGKEGWM